MNVFINKLHIAMEMQSNENKSTVRQLNLKCRREVEFRERENVICKCNVVFHKESKRWWEENTLHTVHLLGSLKYYLFLDFTEHAHCYRYANELCMCKNRTSHLCE